VHTGAGQSDINIADINIAGKFFSPVEVPVKFLSGERNVDDYERFRRVLGVRIRRYRMERKWTQHYIVKNFDFYDSHWRKIEQGKTMSMQTLFKIAQMFNVTMSELLNNLDNEKVSVRGQSRVLSKEPVVKL
jgi:DNA-binding XRE family transcriptional regulator